jgi:hypothetical protein
MARSRRERLNYRSERFFVGLKGTTPLRAGQTCTLLTTNRPAAAGYLYHFATRSDPADAASRRGVAEATNIAALMREAALKSAIFVGVPRVRMCLLLRTCGAVLNVWVIVILGCDRCFYPWLR